MLWPALQVVGLITVLQVHLMVPKVKAENEGNVASKPEVNIQLQHVWKFKGTLNSSSLAPYCLPAVNNVHYFFENVIVTLQEGAPE